MQDFTQKEPKSHSRAKVPPLNCLSARITPGQLEHPFGMLRVPASGLARDAVTIAGWVMPLGQSLISVAQVSRPWVTAIMRSAQETALRIGELTPIWLTPIWWSF